MVGCRRFLVPLMFLPIVSALSPAQQVKELSKDTLAIVGQRVVTERDLIERIELMPWPGKEIVSQRDSVKLKALLSLVAEQLLAQEAMGQGLGQDTLTRIRWRVLEHLLAKDQLYQEEIRQKVSVSQKEIAAGLKRYPWQILVEAFAVRSQKDGFALSEELRRTRGNDSAPIQLDPSVIIAHDTLPITFGLIDVALEDTAFALSPKHPISGPIRSRENGWIVLRYVGRGTNDQSVKQSIPERARAVEAKIKDRKERLAANRYEGEVLSPKRAVVNEQLFDVFADAAYACVIADSEAHRKKGGFTITTTDLDSIGNRLWNRITEGFIECDGDSIPLGDVIEGFRNQRFILPSLERNEFRARLSGSLKIVVEGELMAREALRKHMNLREPVKHDLGVWTNYWLARALEQKVIGGVGVSNDEVMAYLVSHADLLGKSFEVNVREILSDSLKQTLNIMEQVIGGDNMAELARSHSRRSAWAVRGGESGFFRVTEHPELGFAALAEDTGKLAGPVRLPEGYSIFKVLGKREAGKDTTALFDSLCTTVRKVILSEKRQAAINDAISSLAKDQHVRIDAKKLGTVSIQSTQMATSRYLGFGGVILAVPMINPQWQWIKEVEGIQNLLP